jgi:hypothetical protein
MNSSLYSLGFIGDVTLDVYKVKVYPGPIYFKRLMGVISILK